MKRLVFFAPLVVLALLTVYFAAGLMRDPQALPSALVGKPMPDFDLAAIEGEPRGFSRADLMGQVTLVNVFGSWCVACAVEHPFLMELKANNVIPIYGIDWREPDRKAGPEWLRTRGNPYTLVGDDPKSLAAIALGVTGAPETFIVDKRGIIRHRFAGAITREIWQRQLWPIVQKLRAES